MAAVTNADIPVVPTTIHVRDIGKFSDGADI